MKKSIIILTALFLIAASVPASAAKNAGHTTKKETSNQSAVKTSGKIQSTSSIPVTPHAGAATHETPCATGCPVENEPAASQPAGNHSDPSNYDHTQNGTVPAPATGYPADHDNDNNSSAGSSSSPSTGSSDYDHTQNGTIPSASTGYPADYDNGGGSSSDDGSSSSSSSSSSDSYDPYTGAGSGDYNY